MIKNIVTSVWKSHKVNQEIKEFKISSKLAKQRCHAATVMKMQEL